MPRLFVSVVVLVLVGFVASMVGGQGRVGGETLSAPVARTDRGQIVGLV